MRRYRSKRPKDGQHLVHNFPPGPHGDRGQDRPYGISGFRYWITDEPNPNENRCYCGWDGGREHYGTVGYVDKDGADWWQGKKVVP